MARGGVSAIFVVVVGISSFVISSDISCALRRCRATALRDHFERSVSQAAVPQCWAVQQAFLALSASGSAQPTSSCSVRQTAGTLLSDSVVLSSSAAAAIFAVRSLPAGLQCSVVFQTGSLPPGTGETRTRALPPASRSGT